MACDRGHFAVGNKLHASNFLYPSWGIGRRGNVALFYNKLRVDPSFQPISGNAHFRLVCSMGMHMRARYPWQTNACLPIFYFLRAERATRQRRPLLQQVTSRSKLPAHRWKWSFQLGAFSGDANANSSPMAKKYLFANPLLFVSGEGDEATSSSFAVENAGIDASCALVEALIAI